MSEAIWRALAEKALQGQAVPGASLDVLTSRTVEGLAIQPVYPRSLAPGPPALRQDADRGDSGRWRIAQRVDHPDPGEANKLALLDLESGADALTLVFEGETARGFGLPLDAAALGAALGGVELDYIAVRLDAGAAAPAAAGLLAALARTRRLTSARLAVDLGLDPIGSLARTGQAPEPMGPAALKDFLSAGRDAGFAGRVFLADGRPYHEAGAGEVQELAAVLATGVAYLRHLAGAGLDLAAASASIGWLLVADADTFLSIAKIRALRRLWARVEQASGLTPRPLYLHVETAWRMMTRRDPWVNAMRATAAVFAAGIGGADQVAVLPFTAPLGMPEDGARRLARNTQLVLLAEAHLAMVDDPAAGSGGIEALTESLCLRAWAQFQDIERAGGIAASLRVGTVQAAIAETAARRRLDLATGALGITGTSTFPALAAVAVPLGAVARRPQVQRAPSALPAARDAEPFERLCDQVATLAAAGGPRPAVFLAVLGPPARHGAHATDAANFVAAAGLDTIRGAPEAYDAAATPIACICGSDARDTTVLAAVIAALRDAGARRVLVVGTPAGHGHPAAGPDGFIHQRCNALQALEEMVQCLLSGPP